MRKIKKINGYLVVKFNDREKRENEGTGLSGVVVVEAEKEGARYNVPPGQITKRIFPWWTRTEM